MKPPKNREDERSHPASTQSDSGVLIKAKGPVQVERSATGDIHLRFQDADGRDVRVELDELQGATVTASVAHLYREPDHPYCRVYVDESIHDKSGFIATAMVFTRYDVEPRVAEALVGSGLTPGRDEHKSGASMVDKPELQKLRDRILNIAGQYTSIAVMFSPASRRRSLGDALVKALGEVVTKNGIKVDGLEVLVDEGISPPTGLVLAGTPLDGAVISFGHDSRKVFGLQVADEVAHAMAVVLKDQLRGESKTVDIGGEHTGYKEGTEAELEWCLRINHRYAFFTRPVIPKGYAHEADPLTSPLIVDDDDVNDAGEDYVDQAQHPELFGWGAFASHDCSDELRTAIETTFARIWLGCIH